MYEAQDSVGMELDGVSQEQDCRPMIRDVLKRAEQASPELIKKAREIYGSNDIEIDDFAGMSCSADGNWVSAWVWVADDRVEQEAQ